jgi:hypothetical protein
MRTASFTFELETEHKWAKSIPKSPLSGWHITWLMAYRKTEKAFRAWTRKLKRKDSLLRK